MLEQEIKQKIQKAEWPGYVHTYPHKRAYREISKMDILRAWDKANDKLNIYVHIPFCRRKCAYCNLFSTVKENNEQYFLTYVKSILRDIDSYSSYINTDVRILSIYFGGGTPTVLSIELLRMILKKVKEVFPYWDSEIEPCIECSPDDLNEEYLIGLKEIGFKRISIGVQSFAQEELNKVNRKISVANIPFICQVAKRNGLNINLDLIYGLPNQSKESAFSSVKQVVNLNPDTITLYPLAVRKKTGMDNLLHCSMMSMKDKYDMFDRIREELSKKGYQCQTAVRFVKNSKSTYQQQRYEYQGISTLGLGAGARSYTNDLHYSLDYMINDYLVKSEIQSYIQNDFLEGRYVGFFFDDDEKMRRMVTLNLLDPYISVLDFENKFRIPLFEKFGEEIDALLSVGLIEIVNDKVSLTLKGRKYCDIVASIFISENVKSLYATYAIR